MLEALTEECIYNEGSATDQKTNMGFETEVDVHTRDSLFCRVILNKSITFLDSACPPLPSDNNHTHSAHLRGHEEEHGRQHAFEY